MKVAWGILAMSLAAGAQTQPKVDWRKWAPVIADSAARGLDAYSTRRALACTCNHEMFLPDSISHHSPMLVAYGASVVVTDVLISRELAKHGHRKLARWVPMVDAAQDGVFAINNLTLATRSKRAK